MLSLAKLASLCIVVLVLGCGGVLGAVVQPVVEGIVTAAQNFAVDIKATADVPVFDANCNAAQQAAVNAAIPQARRYIDDAYNYFQAFGGVVPAPADPRLERYKTWFGDFDVARFNEVLQRVTALHNKRIEDFTYGCSPENCRDQNGVVAGTLLVYAYVLQNVLAHGRINLCPPFFNSVQSSGITRAHVLVHETSHFNAGALPGTNENNMEWYTSLGAWTLARTNPANAVKNADSYAWFARNEQGCGLAKCVIL
ncbi:hypothetical protein ONZ45_g3695 [Pleurotus djamor]|nr:hypothetical protein ONZ45_g3695 [Pleurotus djamor]